MAIEIVKVQVPLAGGVGNQCLIYDKNRRHVTEGPLLRHVAEALNGDAKGYFKAAWSSIAGWGVSERVGPQDW